MQFLEMQTPTSPSRRTQSYAVSPHKDVTTFVKGVIGANKHNYLKSKLLIQPVYKDDAQRNDVHLYARQMLNSVGVKGRVLGRYARFAAARGWPAPKSDEAAAAVAYTDLYQHSRRGASSRMNFAGITDAEPTVRVYGHGAAGDMSLGSHTGEETPVNKLAKFLDELLLPKDSRLKIDGCFTGAGKKPNACAKQIMPRYTQGTLRVIADVDHSFAAEVHRVLTKDFGFRGKTYGYLLETADEAMSAITLIGTTAQHMACGFYANDLPDRPYILLRKKDVRVRFP